jgi:site-specific recombinase XerD
MNTQITFSQAIDGYFLAARARHLSSHTLADYANTFRKFAAFLTADPHIGSITHQHVEDFLRVQTVSNKTILNYTIGLSALWHWALKEDLVTTNILQQVEKPKPEKPAIQEFSLADIRAMLSSLERSKAYTRPGKKESSNLLQNAARNRAIILLLLDTGLRASEICALRISDLDVRNSILRAFGKGKKERFIPFSPRTGQAIWRYLATRKDDRQNDPLFTTRYGHPLDRDQLRRLLERIGTRAQVSDVHPHRFRHTFAINYLRNGGDTFTLQLLLGHSTMEMVRTYLNLANADLQNGHRRASPVDNWRL